ncbi:hypothetical protein BH11BAC2_BH11BAC2_01490 [soil metagenome]
MRKNLTLLVLLVLLGSAASAQYYYLPFTSPGQNPGNLNTDLEYPVGGGLDASWTPIKGSSATPAWSNVQTLPFTFNFDGVNVTDFKVSTTGILTFDTGSAMAPPSSSNQVLPNAAIPDKSICIWGIQGTGTNDSIVVKEFGTAPNRQYWVLFSSYSLGGAAATAFTYFSIVLEETTNNIYIVDQRSSQTSTLTLGVQINSTTAFDVAGAPSTGILAGTDPSSADNAYYQFIQGVQVAEEAELTSLNVTQFVTVPGSSNIAGSITNYGANPINTITIKWENAGNVYSDTKTGLNIPFASSYSFTHATPLSVPNAITYPVKVWIELAGDANQNNDTLNAVVSGLTFLPNKKVVFEEATGTWCGWCPRGAVFMDSLSNVHPNDALLIAVHNADPMTNVIYDAGIGGLIGGYPSGLVDRYNIDVDPSSFFVHYANRINDVAPMDVNVGVTYDANTTVMTIELSATLASDLAGDYRFNAVVVEEDVTGTASNYNQTNYYANNAQGVMGGYEVLPNPVPAAQMHYDHVGREILGGWDGQAGSMPATMTANGVYTYTFNYTVPVSYDISQMHVIGWVTDPNGRILNANRGDLAVGIAQPAASTFTADLFPNPTTSANSNLVINLQKSAPVTVEIYDMTGKMVRSNSSTLSAGEYQYSLNLAGLQAGVYNVNILANGEKLNKRLVIAE